jgi:hypothetical protein
MSDRDPLQSLWTNQPEESFTMSLAEIHTHAARFQTRIRWRNAAEYVAAAVVVMAFGWMAFAVPVPMVQAGAALIVAGALYVCWKLNELGRAASKAELEQASSLADFHRAELTRQRAALSTVWRWYLGPFVPGLLVFLAGVAFAPELEAPFAARFSIFATGVGFTGLIFAAVGWLNALAVKRLDREIAALDQAR